MLRKMIGFVVAGLVVLFVLFGRDTVSYIRTTWGYVDNAVHDAVPIEFEIQRARNMVEDLTPEIRKNMRLIATEEVELDRLAKRIEQLEQRLAEEKEDILKLSEDLKAGKKSYIYGGRHYSEEEVRQDLAQRLERYKTGEETLKNLRQLYDARQRGLQAARKKLEGMLAARRQLLVEVENLEARLKMLQAAQTASVYQFDDSKLARTKKLVEQLRARLDVAAKLLDADQHFHDQIPVRQQAEDDILKQVEEYLGKEQSDDK